MVPSVAQLSPAPAPHTFDRLKELLRKRLIECGWHDDLKARQHPSSSATSFFPPPLRLLQRVSGV